MLHQFKLYYDGKKLVVDKKFKPIEEHEDYIYIPVEEVLGPIIENNRKIRGNYLKLLSEISDHFDEILLES